MDEMLIILYIVMKEIMYNAVNIFGLVYLIPSIS